jgi:site-specific DNA-cytosine methylase
MIGTLIEREVRHAHLFCGISGGAMGFNRGEARVGSSFAKFRCVGGIDVDAAACRDFQSNAKARASCLDLFSLEQLRREAAADAPAGAICPDRARTVGGGK